MQLVSCHLESTDIVVCIARHAINDPEWWLTTSPSNSLNIAGMFWSAKKTSDNIEW